MRGEGEQVIENDGNDIADLPHISAFAQSYKVLNNKELEQFVQKYFRSCFLKVFSIAFLLTLTIPRPVFGSSECEQIGIPMCQVFPPILTNVTFTFTLQNVVAIINLYL